MTANFHTPIVTGAAAAAATINNPLAELDEAIGLLGGGANVTDEVLIGWTEGGLYAPLVITRNANDMPTSATVKWPDGSGGVYTVTALTGDGRAVDAYTITHVDSGKTVTQAAPTRNSNGSVTVKPALTVA